MNKQYIHFIHHILQIMIDRSNVKREEAVPRSILHVRVTKCAYSAYLPMKTMSPYTMVRVILGIRVVVYL